MIRSRLNPEFREIHRVIELEVDTGAVWAALTESARLGLWLCDKAYFRPEVGAPFRFEWGGGLHADGQVSLCEVESVLAYSYRVPVFQECVVRPTEVRISLQPVGTGCELTLQHTGFLPDESWDAYFEGHRQCWDVDLAKLDRLLSAEPIGEVLRLEFSLATSLDELLTALDLSPVASLADSQGVGAESTAALRFSDATTRTLLWLEKGDRVIITESHAGDVPEKALYEKWCQRLGQHAQGSVTTGSPYS